ncbi:MAG: MlrC C-terminal domain-containing protein [Caldilineaceae bacterium]
MPLMAQVRLLSDGRFINESHRSIWDAGHSALLESGGLTLVVTSRPVSLYDRSLFYAHGQEPQHFDAVVVKSPHCQPHMFAVTGRRPCSTSIPMARPAPICPGWDTAAAAVPSSRWMPG